MDKNNKATNDLTSKNRTEFADDLNTDTEKKVKPGNTPNDKRQ